MFAQRWAYMLAQRLANLLALRRAIMSLPT